MIKSQYWILKTKISTPFFIQNFQSICTINPDMGGFSYSYPPKNKLKILEIELQIGMWNKETRGNSNLMQEKMKTYIKLWIQVITTRGEKYLQTSNVF